MGTLQIIVGDLHFSARWEAAAPRTIEAIRHMLPIESKLIHCRWTGESTWIPFGEFRPGLDYENHTSHPAPGQLAIYPGGISECEIFFPYGGCTTASKVGQLAANHFATVVADDGWDDRLREMGRRCLWEGAQAISIREVGVTAPRRDLMLDLRPLGDGLHLDANGRHNDRLMRVTR